MFGKKQEKQKSEKELRQEEINFEKRQLELLVALRTKSELKIEKSAIVTLSHVSDLVRNQALINKSLIADLKNKKVQLMDFTIEISELLTKTFDNVDSMKAHLKILIDKNKAMLKE